MLVQFTVSPVGEGESLKAHVAEILDIVDRSGVKYQFTAMSTILEGDEAAVMDLVMRCHRRMRQLSRRVVTTITIDDREGALDRLAGKVRDVEDTLGRSLQKH